MRLLNRTAITIRPKQPYIDWANSFSDGGPTFISATAREVFDVSGAGDTVIAALAAMLASGAALPQAMHVANCAAGIVVGKLGTAVVHREELQAALAQD